MMVDVHFLVNTQHPCRFYTEIEEEDTNEDTYEDTYECKGVLRI